MQPRTHKQGHSACPPDRQKQCRPIHPFYLCQSESICGCNLPFPHSLLSQNPHDSPKSRVFHRCAGSQLANRWGGVAAPPKLSYLLARQTLTSQNRAKRPGLRFYCLSAKALAAADAAFPGNSAKPIGQKLSRAKTRHPCSALQTVQPFAAVQPKCHKLSRTPYPRRRFSQNSPYKIMRAFFISFRP